MATPTFVQRASGNNNGGTTSTQSSLFTNTAGNCIIVGVMNDTTTAVTSVTDLAGNTYTKIQGEIVGDEVAVWAAYNIAAFTNNRVSFANGSNDGAIWAEEWSGIATSLAADQKAVATGAQTSGTITCGPTPTTTQATELVWALFSVDWATGAAMSPGTGFSNSLAQNFTGGGSSFFVSGMNESKVVTTTGAQSATATITNPSGFTWRAVVVTFKAASGATTNQSLTAGLSFTGGFSKLPRKSLTATLSFSGSIKRAVSKKLTAAALSFSGAVKKQTTRRLTGALGFTGNFSKATTFRRSLTAALSFSGALAQGRAYVRNFTANLSFTGGLSVAQLIWTRIKTVVFGASKPGTVQTGSAFTTDQSGGTIETVSSGTKNETTQTGQNNETVQGGDTKETL